jgi:hypothetical protein
MYSAMLALSINEKFKISMKLKELLKIFSLLIALSNVAYSQTACIEGTIQAAGGATSITNCEGDGFSGVVRFRTTPSAMPFAFLITDENNIIIQVSLSNFINLEDLPQGAYRVWAFSYLGQVTAEPGQDAANAQLASLCYQLTSNYIQIINVVPDGETVATTDGATSQFICSSAGASGLVGFTTTSQGPEYAFLITDETNTILAVATDPEYNFEDLPEGTYLVWGVAYAGNLTAEPGQDATTATLSDGCFDLSDNFIKVVRAAPDGGTVSLTNGQTSDIACEGNPAGNLLSFASVSASIAPYVFILTNDNNIIIEVLDDNTYDFTDIAPGSYRVWGVSFTGNLTAQAGDDVAVATLSDECFDLSDNFVEIIRRDVDGATVSLADGSSAAVACVGDGQADEFSFANTSTSMENYVYIITDENNIIIDVFDSSTFDFEDTGAGAARVWGLAFSGNFIAQAGDDATSVNLSDECFDLSDNFVEIDRKETVGGNVVLSGGVTAAPVCVGDGIADPLQFETDGSGETYVFVLTDENNIIVEISGDGVIDFENAGPGVSRIWGLAFSGNLIAQAGDDASAVDLSDECFDLSDNFVEITRLFVDGGEISLQDGSVSAIVCGSDFPGPLTFTAQSTSTENYSFIVTDQFNNILIILVGNTVDFGLAAPGQYRIWGLSYTGQIIADIGDNAAGTDLTDGCFELSANFIQISKDIVEGGTVSIPSGEPVHYTCPGDGNPDVINFATTGSSTGDYIYVLTDEDNNILELVDGDSFDFEDMAPGTCRVWGLAYSGDITAQIGDNAADVDLSNGCFELSDNFITVVKEVPEGGTVATTEGETLRYTCPDDGIEDVIAFEATGASGGPYVFVITDEENNIVALLDGDSFDFEELGQGTSRVWGLAFTGEIIAQPGDNAAATNLTDDCWDLSDNFVTIIREISQGGVVALSNGQTTAFVCPGDGNPDVLQFDSIATSAGQYAYIITDTNNVILALIDGDTYDFDDSQEGVNRVWGLAYTGDIIAQVGDTASIADLTTGCWDLSTNFVTVNIFRPDAGTITSNGGATELVVCVGDGVADVIEFNISGSTPGGYLYLVTDTEGYLVGALEDPTFNFDNAVGGEYRVYGLAYTGNPVTIPGDNIFEVELSTDCWDLTDNFLALTLTRVNGGNLFTNQGQGTVYVCPGDGIADIITFFSTTDANQSPYQFFITDQENKIIAFLNGNQQDFESTGFTVLRVWGVSYTGNFLADFGDDADEIEFSDECWDLSNTFITVVRSTPDGGQISTSGGETSLLLCVGAVDAAVEMTTTSSSLAGYVYLLTDTSNVIIDISNDNLVDFTDLEADQLYRIWGLSYTGALLAQIGENAAEIELASSCFDLSDNFVEVYRSRPLNGGELTTLTGETTLYTCPGDDNADLAILFTTSLDTGYQYVITDPNNKVVVPNIVGSVIDFNNAAPGEYRIYGVAYFGDFFVGFGDDITVDPLSDSCYVPSSNFITVLHFIPVGGKVFTDDEQTEVTVIVGDGEPDLITFINQDASNSKYAYIVTDEDNIILEILDGDSKDFETTPAGDCRVWGVAYTGELIAQIGENAAVADLSDDCFSLSETFVLVKRVDAFGNEGPDLNLRAAPTDFADFAELHIAPNPASELMTVTFTIRRPQSDVSAMQVFSATGQRVFTLKMPTHDGKNQYDIDIHDLVPGIYFLHMQNGQTVERVRFMKQ